MATVLYFCLNQKLQVDESFAERVTVASEYHLSKHAFTKHNWLVVFVLAITLQPCNLWHLKVNAERQNIGTWKTGNWGICYGDSCGYGGLQQRGVSCTLAHLSVDIPQNNCNRTEKPSSEQDCFKVCAQHKKKFQWVTKKWGDCRHELSCRSGDSTCSDPEVLSGVQRRNVECVNSSNVTDVVDDYICLTFLPQPVTKQTCVVPSPVDCVASIFGEWTKCTVSCGNGSQIRSRRVLRNARFGGKRCPDMLEVRPCSGLPSCMINPTNHRMKFEKWSECKVATVDETCPLMVSCAVSHWSEWGACSTACGEEGKQIRSRDVVRLPQGDEPGSCPVTIEARPCNASLDAIIPCFRYRWMAGSWGKCRPIYNATCGGGEQSRQVYCSLDNDVTEGQMSTSKYVVPLASDSIVAQQPVDERKCIQNLKPVEWQECDLPCPEKCHLGPWSAWSKCAPTHCPGDPSSRKPFLNRRRKHLGFKRRIRQMLNALGSNGSCNHTLEVAPCDKASCFSWHISTSLPCHVNRGSCGNGTMSHHQVCQDLWGKSVNDEKCQDSTKFPAVTPCHAACPSDCVLSEWSSWTSCPCRSKKQKSKQQVRSRFILVHPGLLGSQCPDADDLTQSRPCKSHECSIYYWKARKWEECRLPLNGTGKDERSGVGAQGKLSRWAPFSIESTQGEFQGSEMPSCPVGFQTRSVICKKKKQSGKVSRKNCIDWDKRVSTRSCAIECSIDCMLSMWSEWTSCEEECARITATRHHGLRAAFQQRHRYVIHESVGQAGSCSNELDQTRPCLTQQCAIYEWRMRKWSPCLLAVGMVSAFENDGKCLGVKTRIVTCYRVTLNESREPVKHDYCLKSGRRIPLATRPCLTHCPRDFSFNEWKQRLPCQAELHPPIQLSRHEVVSMSTLIPKNPIVKPIGPWSACFTDPTILPQFADECIISKPNDVSLAHNSPSCGMGKRRRAVGCFEEGTGIMFSISFCNYRDFDEEDCQVPCPIDCQMSGWSAWENCQVLRKDLSKPGFLPCGDGLRVRFRHLTRSASHGGRPCPVVDDIAQMYKSELCHSECDKQFGVATNWKPCDIPGSSADSCGRDIQTQEVVCYKRFRSLGLSNITQEVTDVRLCNLNETFIGLRQCNTSCLDACVLSEWSMWQGCSRCTGEPRTRRRRVLRQPNAGASCSDHFKETGTCLQNINCFTYSWEWTLWSTCTLPERAKCGMGVQQRKANCLRSDGVPVSTAKCVAHNVAVPTSQSNQCRVDCPFDCRLSDWSVWSSCSASCGLSRVRTRIRKVTRYAAGSGRPCSDELTQHLPCCAKPCYMWKLMGWKECQLPGYNCGEGAQEMEVACVEEAHYLHYDVTADGTRVNETLCRLEQRRQERGSGTFHEWFPAGILSRPCYVSCPWKGRLTEWSAWGECHGGCNNFTRFGTKSRSRIAYKDEIDNGSYQDYDVEESQCEHPTCFSYTWKTSDFVTRSVWCQRDPDGVVVASGCKQYNKPAKEIPRRECYQNCNEIKHGYCSAATGECNCISPLFPIYSTDEELLECSDSNVSYPATSPRIITWKSAEIIIKSENATKVMESTRPPLNETTPYVTIWPPLNPLNPDGTLKAWAYGVIAGLLVLLIFIVTISYVVVAACRRSGRKPRRCSDGSGSNMGIGIVASSGGSYAYGPGGNGLPPYYMSNATLPARCKLDQKPSPSSSLNSSYFDAAVDDEEHYYRI